MNAFSVKDFKLVKATEGEQKGHVQVTITSAVEPMARGLIQLEWSMVEAFDSPLEEGSQRRINRSIGDIANATGVSETEEAGWRHTFGQFFELIAKRGDQPDPALEELKRRFREEGRKALATHFKILLQVANDFSWDNFIQGEADKYGNTEPPRHVQDELTAKHADYLAIKQLIERNPQAGQSPRFVLVNSQGREMFRSVSDLHIPQP